LCKADNPEYGIAPKAKRQIDFELRCLWPGGSTLASPLVTATTGLPMTSAAALRALCGKPGAAKKALAALDADNVHARGAAAAEALGDGVPLDDDGTKALPFDDDAQVRPGVSAGVS